MHDHDKKWPAWFYGPDGEAKIFHSEKEVPEGWHDHPSKHEKAEKSKRGRPAKDAPLDL